MNLEEQSREQIIVIIEQEKQHIENIEKVISALTNFTVYSTLIGKEAYPDLTNWLYYKKESEQMIRALELYLKTLDLVEGK